MDSDRQGMSGTALPRNGLPVHILHMGMDIHLVEHFGGAYDQ
jgi:hypothetical protein